MLYLAGITPTRYRIRRASKNQKCNGLELVLNQVNFRMSSFGGLSAKPMVLFSNAPWIAEVLRYAVPPATPLQRCAVLHPDSDGNMRPRGSTDPDGGALKASQAYTYQFGMSVANVYAQNRRAWRKRHSPEKVCNCSAGDCPDAHSLVTEPAAAGEDVWADAQTNCILHRARADAQLAVPDVLVESVFVID